MAASSSSSSLTPSINPISSAPSYSSLGDEQLETFSPSTSALPPTTQMRSDTALLHSESLLRESSVFNRQSTRKGRSSRSPSPVLGLFRGRSPEAPRESEMHQPSPSFDPTTQVRRGKQVAKGERDLGTEVIANSKGRTPQLVFSLPSQTEFGRIRETPNPEHLGKEYVRTGKSERRRISFGNVASPAVVTLANASASTGSYSEPPMSTKKETSAKGPRELLRRARSFGTSPILASAGFLGSGTPPPLPTSPSLSPMQIPSAQFRADSASPKPSSDVENFSDSMLESEGHIDPGKRNSSSISLQTNEAKLHSINPKARRSTFSIFRRTESANSSVNDVTKSKSGRLTSPSTTSLGSTKNNLSTASSKGSTKPSLPPLPSLHLSASPYRMSWSFGSPDSSSMSPLESKISLENTSRQNDSRERGDRASADIPIPPVLIKNIPSDTIPLTESKMTSSPTDEQSLYDYLGSTGLGLGLTSHGAKPDTLPNKTSLTRIGRSHSDVVRPYLQAQDSGSTLTPFRSGTSPGSAEKTMPVGIDRDLGSSLSSSMATTKKPLSRPTTSGSTADRKSGMFGAVSNFFGSSGTNQHSSRSMSRTSSLSSSGRNTPGFESTSDFGALFSSVGNSASSKGRSRGLSVGNSGFGGFSTSDNRKRAGSTSSLSSSWIPPPQPWLNSLPGMGLSLEDSNDAGASTGSQTSRSRASTDPSRFSHTQSGSSLSSVPMSSNGAVPSASPGRFGSSTPPSPVLNQFQIGASGQSGILRKASFGEENGSAPLTTFKLLPIEEEESAEAYLLRLSGAVKRSDVPRLLASKSEPFYAAALTACMKSFDFTSDPLDVALRKFLMEASLPVETQQIDRLMEAFATRYHGCNTALYENSDIPYVLSFSLVMLSTDQFNPNNKNKMSKADYVKNTRMKGVSTEVLEYFFDQITISPFVFVDDEEEAIASKEGRITPSTSSFFSKPGLSQKEKNKADLYQIISSATLADFRINVGSIIPLKSPFSFTGTTNFFDATELHLAFTSAPILHLIESRPRSKSSAADSAFLESIAGATNKNEKGNTSNVKITKFGLLGRKEDVGEGSKKAASKKWKVWTVILTTSQLLFFVSQEKVSSDTIKLISSMKKDAACTTAIQQSIAQAKILAKSQGTDTPLELTLPSFKPDAVVSLANSAAIYDTTYVRDSNVFRLHAPTGRRYLFQAQNGDDLNAWLACINYAASFKTANLRMRTAGALKRSGSAKTGPRSSLIETLPPMPLSSTPMEHSQTSTVSVMDDLLQDSPSLLSDKQACEISTSSTTCSTPRSSAVAVHTLEADKIQETMKDTSAASSRPISNNSVFPDDLNRPLHSRADFIRKTINNLEIEIAESTRSLNEELHLARNMSVLTPFSKITRDRLYGALEPISTRIRAARFSLAKNICHREVMARELLVEDRGHRSTHSRRSSVRRPSSPRSKAIPVGYSTQDATSPKSVSQPWKLPLNDPHASNPDYVVSREDQNVTSTPRPAFNSLNRGQTMEVIIPWSSTDERDPIAEAALEIYDQQQYGDSLTDDELDRLRSPTLMQRSTTEGINLSAGANGPRLFGIQGRGKEKYNDGFSEDELPPSTSTTMNSFSDGNERTTRDLPFNAQSQSAFEQDSLDCLSTPVASLTATDPLFAEPDTLHTILAAPSLASLHIDAV